MPNTEYFHSLFSKKSDSRSAHNFGATLQTNHHASNEIYQMRELIKESTRMNRIFE